MEMTNEVIKKLKQSCPLFRDYNLGELIQQGVLAKVATEQLGATGDLTIPVDIDILDEIFKGASTTDGPPSQQERLLDTLNTKQSSFPTFVRSAVRSGDWSKVVMILERAVMKGDLTETDRDYIYTKLPLGE